MYRPSFACLVVADILTLLADEESKTEVNIIREIANVTALCVLSCFEKRKKGHLLQILSARLQLKENTA